MTKDILTNIKSKCDHESFARLGTCFKTDSKYYFFDTGTGKVLECGENAYKILLHWQKANAIDNLDWLLSEKDLLDGLKEIQEAINNEHILQAYPVETLTDPQFEDIEKGFSNLQLLCLELTEECNLRCGYCIYQEGNKTFRNFASSSMDFSTAKKAIDYFFENSETNDVFFSFYGGEPLLKFDLIVMCISYILSVKGNHTVRFTMTTNGTLLDAEKAAFFSSIPNFNIVFSIDGDRDIHNQYRKFKNGEGSFDLAYRGFKNAVTAFGDNALEHISFNSVVSPPYTSEKFDKMQHFFDENARGFLKQYSYVEFPTSEEDQNALLEYTKNRTAQEWDPVFGWATQNTLLNKSLFSAETSVKSLLILHKRMISDKPVNYYKFNGCCLPGGRKLYVTTHGDFKACEKVGEAPNIGNLNRGIDRTAVKAYYIDDYLSKSLDDCRKCWAINLCGICYASCYDDKGINLSQKKIKCEGQRFLWKQTLIHYHKILEQDPTLLDFLNERELK